jgi:hypothetical protein
MGRLYQGLDFDALFRADGTWRLFGYLDGVMFEIGKSDLDGCDGAARDPGRTERGIRTMSRAVIEGVVWEVLCRRGWIRVSKNTVEICPPGKVGHVL